MDAAERHALLEILERSRTAGFLGPGEVEPHIVHAAGFAQAAGRGIEQTRALDLGAGGGVPGLVLAVLYPTWSWVLLDAMQRRAAFLEQAVDELGLQARVEVRWARAEVAGRDPGLRGSFDLVTARGFGPPAVTAECGVAFLQVGGVLVVSEPPGDASGARWSQPGLALLGCRLEGTERSASGGYAVIRQEVPLADRYPRRTGVPSKRPLFESPDAPTCT